MGGDTFFFFFFVSIINLCTCSIDRTSRDTIFYEKLYAETGFFVEYHFVEFSVPFVGRVSYRVVYISEFCDAIRLEYVLSFVTVREKAFDG